MIFTTKEYLQELNRRAAKVKDAKVLLPCVGSVHADMMKRIFDEGKNNAGSPHGTYSTNPIYLNAEFSARKTFQPVGKTGRSAFKSGKPHKTKYFPGGYRQFKSEAIGISKVNFQVFGDLRSDWTNTIQLLGSVYVTGTKREENSDKVEGLIDRFGVSSFKFSQKEREKFLKCAGRRLTNIMQGARENN